MTRRLLLAVLAGSSVVLFVGFCSGGAVLEVITAGVAFLFPVALAGLGAVGCGGRLGRTWVPLVGLLLLLEGCLVGMLLLEGRVLDVPWVGGLPLAAALQIYVLGGGSLVLVSLAFAVLYRDDSS